MDLRVAAYAVVERRGKILLTHWRRGHLHGWTLPGGGIDPGEDPRDAVVREVFEETGLEARVGKLLGVDSRVMVREDVPEGHEPELHTIRIVYRATVKDGPLRHEVGGSSDEARWVPLREIKSLRTLSLVQTSLHMAGINPRKQAAKDPKAGQPKQTGQKPVGQSRSAEQKSGQAKQGQPKKGQRGGQRSRQRSGAAQRQRGEQAAAQSTGQPTPQGTWQNAEQSASRGPASKPRRAKRPAGE